MSLLSETKNCFYTGSKQARDDGYYALHCYFTVSCLIDLYGVQTECPVQVEIQFSTQLQDVLYDITHLAYEKKRMQISDSGKDWKWNLEAPEFRLSYISHSLHLLEAMIIDVRKDMSSEADYASSGTGNPEIEGQQFEAVVNKLDIALEKSMGDEEKDK